MSKSRRKQLATYLLALIIAVTGCTTSLGNEITREPKPTRAGTRDCGSDIYGIADCLGELLAPEPASPFPKLPPPDSAVVRNKGR